MIKAILILICLCFLANYIILHIKAISTDKEIENDQNFWMFTYDFKEKKRDSIFDRESENIIKEKKLETALNRLKSLSQSPSIHLGKINDLYDEKNQLEIEKND